MIDGRERPMAFGCLAVSMTATVATVAGGFQFAPFARASLVTLAFAPLVAVALMPALRAAVSVRLVLMASTVLSGLSVALPSSESRDLWSYAMDGRIVSDHDASPYVHSPAFYPHDPFLHLVGSGWRHTRSVYGPLFTGLSAVITAVTGNSQLPTRLAFQVLAASAVLACAWIVARVTHDPIAVMIVGLNPLIALEIVNPGRNDAIVGLALLTGVVLIGRRRLVAGAIVVTLAALVKVVALAALGAVLVWLWRHHGLRLATRAATCSAVLLVVPYLLVGGTTALHPLAGATDRLSRASIWQVARDDGIQHLLGTEPAEPVRRVLGFIGPMALLLVAALGLLWVLSRLADPTPELVAVAAVAAFLLAGSYVLGSYVMWVLPILAWRHRAGISRVLLVWSSLLVIAYQAAPGMPTQVESSLVWLAGSVTVVCAVAGIVGLCLVALGRLRADPWATSLPDPAAKVTV